MARSSGRPTSATVAPILKVLLLGDSFVGKSSLYGRIVDGAFTTSYKATVGVDFGKKAVTLDSGKTVMLQIWDTAGSERFQSISPLYFRGAQVCILVFDVANVRSFESLTVWRDEFLEHHASRSAGGSDVLFAVIGNKVDLGRREVPRNRALQWVEKTLSGQALYFETSAKTAFNVAEVFQVVAEECARRGYIQHDADEYRPGVDLDKSDTKSGSRCC